MRPLIMSLVLVGVSSVSFAGPNQQSWIKALETMDHVSREAYSAVYNRTKKIDKSVFQELKHFSQGASPWQNSQWSTKESTSFAPCGMELKMLKASQWSYEKSACGSFPAQSFARIKVQAEKLELEIPMDAWKGRVDFGSASGNQTARCELSFKAESLEKVKCQGLHFANNEGEELRLSQLSYDQTAKNVVDIEGELLLADGSSEKVLLTAPTRSSKMFVTLVRKEIVTESVEPKQPVAKTEEEVLSEMKELAQNWDEWDEHTAVYGDPSVEGDVNAKALEREEAYRNQDLASPEGELVQVEGEGEVYADGEAIEEDVQYEEEELDQEEGRSENRYQAYEQGLPDIELSEQAAHAVRPTATKSWEHSPGR